MGVRWALGLPPILALPSGWSSGGRSLCRLIRPSGKTRPDKLLDLPRKCRPVVVAIDTEQFYAVSSAQSHLAPVSPYRRSVGLRAAEELDWLGVLLALVLNGNLGCRNEDVEMLLSKPGGDGSAQASQDLERAP